MPYLKQKNQAGTIVKSWQLAFKPIVFGRGDEVEAQIEDKQMSRVHFAIEHADGAHVVRDRGSSNGTFVNGKRVQENKLDEGDTITAGGTTFTYDYGMSTMLNAVEGETGDSIQNQLSDMYKNLGNLDEKK